MIIPGPHDQLRGVLQGHLDHLEARCSLPLDLDPVDHHPLGRNTCALIRCRARRRGGAFRPQLVARRRPQPSAAVSSRPSTAVRPATARTTTITRRSMTRFGATQSE